MTTYTYQVGGINGGADVTRLFKEISDAGYNVSTVAFNNNATEVNIESSATQAQIDAIVAAHEGPDSLMCYKAAKYTLIDKRTDELISGGFQYASKIFSLSPNAQAKMMGINQIRNEQEVVYPIRWNTKDDNDYYEIQNANDMKGFYLTGVGTYRYHVDSGTALKDQVRAATSKAEVDAVVDNR